MRVLVGCEFSGVVRDAFAAKGHDAMSCDLQDTETPGRHYKGDIRDVLDYPWDLAIFHPPCTHLSVSGAAWFKEKVMDGRQQSAVSFFMALAKADIPKIAIENPVCIMSTVWRKPDQVIQPWQYGHPETKATCLWLKGLEKLVTTENVEEQMMELPKNQRERLHYLPPSETRANERSRTFTGIAKAMSEQWG